MHQCIIFCYLHCLILQPLTRVTAWRDSKVRPVLYPSRQAAGSPGGRQRWREWRVRPRPGAQLPKLLQPGSWGGAPAAGKWSNFPSTTRGCPRWERREEEKEKAETSVQHIHGSHKVDNTEAHNHLLSSCFLIWPSPTACVFVSMQIFSGTTS